MSYLLSNKKIKQIVLFLVTCLAIVSLIQGIRNGARDSQDFQWDAAKVLSMGINPYDESLNPSGILDGFEYDEYYLQMEANQFPSLLMILFPFTVLKPLTARYVWLTLNVLLTGLMVFLLRKTFLEDMEKTDFYMFMCFMIAGTPYRNQIGVGQHTIFAFCFFLLAVYISEYCQYFKDEKNNRSLLKIILVSLCLFVCYFKYTLTVPLVLYFIYKKRYIEIVLSGIYHIILTFVSALMLNESFINMIIKPLKVSSALSSEGGLDFGALLNGSKLAYVLLLAVMIILLYLALKMPTGHEKALMSVLTLWSVIIIYHRTYDFFVAVLAVALFYDMPDYVKNNIKLYNAIKTLYCVMFISIYFVLRIFSEATPAKIVAGTIYYVLSIIVTYVVIRGYINVGERDE